MSLRKLIPLLTLIFYFHASCGFGETSSESATDEVEGVLSELLQSFMEPGENDKLGWSPLHRAAANSDDPAIIHGLIAAGGDLNARDDRGWTPLHEAAYRNENLPILAALIEAGADPNARNDPSSIIFGSNENPGVSTGTGCMPLHMAAGNNKNPDIITALIDAGANPAEPCDLEWTPLHHAAADNESLAVVLALIDAGADPNARGWYGKTPLHEAAYKSGNPAIVTALIAAGADPYALTKGGMLPSTFAFLNKNPAIALSLVDGIDPNSEIEYGFTLLHAAVGSIQLVEKLLAAGADPNALDHRNRSPLHEAGVYAEDPAVIFALIAAGADPNTLDKFGNTPLDSAMSNYALKGTDAIRQLKAAQSK